MSDRDVMSVERVVHAPAAAIFEVLSDPSRHHEFDGSGTVQEAKGVTGPVGLSDRFGMSMKMGLPYAMENEVVEFEQDRLIAWRTTAPSKLGRTIGGRIWRYELEPVEDGTLVRETWDLTGESAISRPVVRTLFSSKTRQNMTATLDRLEDLLGEAPAP